MIKWMKKTLMTGLLLVAGLAGHAWAGIVDPDCTAEKAAKSAAAKATVGVGGRCSAGEAAKDSAKRAAGVEEKGSIEKARKKNDTPVQKAKEAVAGKN